MLESLLAFLDVVDDFLWVYVGVPAIVSLGLYFSFKLKWLQVVRFPQITKTFLSCFDPSCKKEGRGINPLYAFFASIGGCIGIGNVVGVATAVQIGGPGALFWIWVTGLVGMIIKYSEIYLGVKHRIKNNNNSYDGGPMIYLQRIFKGPWVPRIVSLLLCVYGVEIYMFRTITHSIVSTWQVNHNLVIALLLVGVLLVNQGGVKMAGKISSALIPVFLVVFSGISFWVFFQNISYFPALLIDVFKSAFSGHAAIGGFAGSSIMTTMSQGVRRACYTGDVGIGYASIIHSETSEAIPSKQASLGVFGIFLDTFVICTISVLLILVTGVWKEGIHADYVVAAALDQYLPHMDIIWPLFILLLGYSSLVAFFAVGRKAAIFLSPKYGSKLYFLYAVFAFLTFSFIGTEAQSLTIMSITGVFLLSINLFGMFKLREDVKPLDS